MRELPEPEGQLAWQTYTRDQVLAIQKQAYEDGVRDAAEIVSTGWSAPTEKHLCRLLEKDILAMLTASQKEQK